LLCHLPAPPRLWRLVPKNAVASVNSERIVGHSDKAWIERLPFGRNLDIEEMNLLIIRDWSARVELHFAVSGDKIPKGDPSYSFAWSPLPGLSGCFIGIKDDQTTHSSNRPSSWLYRRSR